MPSEVREKIDRINIKLVAQVMSGEEGHPLDSDYSKGEYRNKFNQATTAILSVIVEEIEGMKHTCPSCNSKNISYDTLGSGYYECNNCGNKGFPMFIDGRDSALTDLRARLEIKSDNKE
jgi:hypothetical protein